MPPFFYTCISMNEEPRATTVDEQIATLQACGMVIANPDHVRRVLLSVGYYRMGFYWFQFEIPQLRRGGIRRFRRDTTWEKVEALYNFDNRFRNLLSFYLQTIETDIRTQITYVVSGHYIEDPYWFVNPRCVKQEFVNSFVEKEYADIKKNDIIRKHHRHHPNKDYAPAWKTLNFLMFGQTQRLYEALLDESLCQRIYSRYDVKEYDVFISYLNILRDTRNVCAHSHILYDKKLSRGIKGKLENLDLVSGEEFTIVGILKLVYYMLRKIDPQKEMEMRNALRQLVNQVEYDVVRFAISRLAI